MVGGWTDRLELNPITYICTLFVQGWIQLEARRNHPLVLATCVACRCGHPIYLAAHYYQDYGVVPPTVLVRVCSEVSLIPELLLLVAAPRPICTLILPSVYAKRSRPLVTHVSRSGTSLYLLNFGLAQSMEISLLVRSRVHMHYPYYCSLLEYVDWYLCSPVPKAPYVLLNIAL